MIKKNTWYADIIEWIDEATINQNSSNWTFQNMVGVVSKCWLSKYGDVGKRSEEAASLGPADTFDLFMKFVACAMVGFLQSKTNEWLLPVWYLDVSGEMLIWLVLLASTMAMNFAWYTIMFLVESLAVAIVVGLRWLKYQVNQYLKIQSVLQPDGHMNLQTVSQNHLKVEDSEGHVFDGVSCHHF